MKATPLTEEQLRILRHMLGINTPSKAKPEPYRDYYCAPLNDPALKELEALGMVQPYRRDTYEWFTCTRAGKCAALDSFNKIRWAKAKRVYHQFLSARDAWPDLTFHAFLTEREFADIRRAA